jgi:hypothetical protein
MKRQAKRRFESATIQGRQRDKLIYKIDFRKLGRTGWLNKDTVKQLLRMGWKNVEDGRYEIRVTASDEGYALRPSDGQP